MIPLNLPPPQVATVLFIFLLLAIIPAYHGLKWRTAHAKYRHQAAWLLGHLIKQADGKTKTTVNTSIATEYEDAVSLLGRAGILDVKGQGCITLADLQELTIRVAFKAVAKQEELLANPDVRSLSLVINYVDNLLLLQRLGAENPNFDLQLIRALNFFKDTLVAK